MEDAPRLFRIAKSECPDLWIRLPRHKWPNIWSNIDVPVVPLERTLNGHPLAGLLCGRPFEEVLLELGWRKSTDLGMSICAPKTKITMGAKMITDRRF